MKKAKLLLTLLVLIVIATMGLYACNGTSSDKINGLEFIVDEDGIALSYEGELSFFIKTDDEEETQVLVGFPVDFSEEVGEHIVTAYALNSKGNKVAEGTFKYKTEQVSLSDLTVNGLTVSWTAKAKTVSVKESGDYVPTTETSYVAGSDGATVRVKVEGGFDKENAVYYTGDPISKATRVRDFLSSPNLKVNGNTVSWNKNKEATGYAVSYDGGAFVKQTQTTATLSEIVGNHTIEVKVLGDNVLNIDSEVTTIEYETLRSEMRVTKLAIDKVTLFAVYGSYSVSTDGKKFTELRSDEYVANMTSTVYFRADGGFDQKAKKYYLSDTVSSDLTCAATAAVVVDDCDPVSAKWSATEKGENGWQTSTASLLSSERFDGSASHGFSVANDGVSYRFTTSYSLTDAYNYISFYYRGDGISDLTVSLGKQGDDFSIEHAFGVMPDYWVKVILRFDDDGWMVGEKPLSILWVDRYSDIDTDRPQGLSKHIMEAYSVIELPATFDQMHLIVHGNSVQGTPTVLYLDDLLFGYSADIVSGFEQPLYDLGQTYIAYEPLTGDALNELIFTLDPSTEQTENEAIEQKGLFEIRSTKLSSEGNFILSGEYILSFETASLYLEDFSSDFKMTLSFLENGRSIRVHSAEGVHSKHFAAQNLFKKTANRSLDFDKIEVTSLMKNWSAYTYVTESAEWRDLSALPLSLSERNQSGVLCFTTGQHLTYKIVYGEGRDAIGLANRFSVDIGNYDEDADNINVRFLATDVYGQSYDLKGNNELYWTCEKGEDLETYEVRRPIGIELSTVALIVEYHGSKERCNLYIDNLTVDYYISESSLSDIAAPEIEQNQFTITFHHKDAVSAYEYSLKRSVEEQDEWIQVDADQNYYTVSEMTGVGDYILSVRALLASNDAITRVAEYYFSVEKVMVSNLSVSIGEENTQTVTWRSNGLTSIWVQREEKETQNYILCEENRYVADENVTLHVLAVGYVHIDTENNHTYFYYGQMEIEKKIIVDGQALGTPVITASQAGLSWKKVADANAYAVSINGSNEEDLVYVFSEDEDPILYFAKTEGVYSVRVKAVILENDIIVAYGKLSDVFTYAVERVSFAEIPKVDAEKSDTISWIARAYEVYVIDNGTEYKAACGVTDSPAEYRVELLGNHNLYVKATAGFVPVESGSVNGVYYYVENDLSAEEIINYILSEKIGIYVTPLKTPTLLLHSTNGNVDGLYWEYHNTKDEFVGDVQTERNNYPFLTYWISVDGGEWTEFTGENDIYTFEDSGLEAGRHTLSVMAKGNGANYRDSKESNTYAFEIKDISLGISVDDDTHTANYVSIALRTKRGVAGEDPYITSETSYTAVTTTNLTVIAEGGWDVENKIYYRGTSIEKTERIIVPIKLQKPVLTVTEKQIGWNKVPSATGYKVKVNDALLENPVIYEDGTRVYIKYDTSYSGTDPVERRVEITAYSNNSIEFPDSDAATVTYYVESVKVNIVYGDKSSVKWTYSGKLYYHLKDSTEWIAWEDALNEYVNESGTEEHLYLQARATVVLPEQGNPERGNVYHYVGSDQSVDKDFTAYTLLAPVLEQEIEGEVSTKLLWQRNPKAKEYRYYLLPINATQDAIDEAESHLNDWTVIDENYFIFNAEEHDNKLFLLKAIGDNELITDSPTTLRGLRAVSLSTQVSYELNDNGEAVVTWSKSGISYLAEMGGYSRYDEETFLTADTTQLNIKCIVGHDEENNISYFGSNKYCLEQDIIVPKRLNRPDLTMQNGHFTFVSDARADRYIVIIKNKDGDTVDEMEIAKNEQTIINFRSEVGEYTVSVYAQSNNPVQYPDSATAEMTYRVVAVNLMNLTADNSGVAYFTPFGRVSIREGNDSNSFEEKPWGTESYAPLKSTTITVKVDPGTDTAQKVYYVGDSKDDSIYVTVPIPLETPSLTQGKDAISIAPIPNATGYKYRVNEGSWKDITNRSVSYVYESGVTAYTIEIKAVATNSTQYPDSTAAIFEYRVAEVSLTNFKCTNATFSWSSVAYSVEVQINNGEATPTQNSSYTVSTAGKTRVTVYAKSGCKSEYNSDKEEEENVYYAYPIGQSSVSATGTVDISKLATPSLKVSGTKIVWSEIADATGYEVKVNSGNYSSQSASVTEKSLSNQEGSYKVYVRAKGNGSTILNSDVATYEYTVKTVSLSSLSAAGSKVSWSAVAYKTYVKVNNGAYAPISDSTYSLSGEGTFTVTVKAEGGFDSSAKIYYYANSAIEKSTTVTLKKLAKPNIKSGENGVTWEKVSNASTYSVKVDNGNYKSQSDRNVSFSTTTGMHTIYVKAIGDSSNGYQDSDAAEFTYQTKQTSLTFQIETSTMVTWISDSLKVQYSENNGTDYVDAKYNGYTASATKATKNKSVSFRAVGGFDSVNKIFYNGTTAVQKKSFTLSGLCIGNNFESGASGWTREYFTSKWEETSATSVTSVIDPYGAGSAIRLTSFLNSMSYRFEYKFGDLPESYKSLSFDIKLNDYSDRDGVTTFLRFQDSKSDTYVDYYLSNLSLSPSVWYHVTIFFEDDNLKINMGGKDYSPSTAISSPLVGRSKYYEKIKALDKMYVTVQSKSKIDNGVTVYTHIDNFRFSTEGSSTGKSTIKVKEVDFSDGTVGATYSNSSWKKYEYNSSNSQYVLTQRDILKPETGLKALSLYCGGNTYKITYNESGSSLGEYNHFSIDVGADNNKTVSYRIEIETDSGTLYPTSCAELMSVMTGRGNESLTTLSFNFGTTKVRSVTIYATSADAHFLIDNMTFSKVS